MCRLDDFPPYDEEPPKDAPCFRCSYDRQNHGPDNDHNWEPRPKKKGPPGQVTDGPVSGYVPPRPGHTGKSPAPAAYRMMVGPEAVQMKYKTQAAKWLLSKYGLPVEADADVAAVEMEAVAAAMKPFASVEEYQAWFRDSDARVNFALEAERARLASEVKDAFDGLRGTTPDIDRALRIARNSVLGLLDIELPEEQA